jgi:hypothetical protein
MIEPYVLVILLQLACKGQIARLAGIDLTRLRLRRTRRSGGPSSRFQSTVKRQLGFAKLFLGSLRGHRHFMALTV